MPLKRSKVFNLQFHPESPFGKIHLVKIYRCILSRYLRNKLILFANITLHKSSSNLSAFLSRVSTFRKNLNWSYKTCECYRTRYLCLERRYKCVRHDEISFSKARAVWSDQTFLGFSAFQKSCGSRHFKEMFFIHCVKKLQPFRLKQLYTPASVRLTFQRRCQYHTLTVWMYKNRMRAGKIHSFFKNILLWQN